MIPESAQKIVIDGKFEVLSRIGAGGMGTVFLCQQLGFERAVAVKVLHREDAADAEAQARFEREAQALAQLKHKNIVSLYGYGMHNGEPYIAMERVDGQSLSSLLASNQPMAMERVISISKQLCEALSCAHASGIIHRDIKPNNVIVTADGGIKLIDFGLAKLSAKSSMKDQGLTEAGAAVGSVLYMSPEQCLGEAIDERADLYALGCLMYHCLTGAPPFGGDHSVSVMHQHVSEPLPQIVGVALPDSRLPAMQAFLNIATEKNPAERFSNAGEMLAELERVATNKFDASSASHQQSVRPQEPAVSRRRAPGLLLAGAAVLLVLMVWGGATTYDINRKQTERDSLVAESEQLKDQLKRCVMGSKTSAELRLKVAWNLIAQADLTESASERSSKLNDAALEFRQVFLWAQHAGGLSTPDLLAMADRVLKGKWWTAKQQRDLTVAATQAYLQRFEKDAMLPGLAFHQLAACKPANDAAWGRQLHACANRYAADLNMQGHVAQAQAVALQTAKIFEPLAEDRIYAIAAYVFADQTEWILHPEMTAHRYYDRAVELFTGYAPTSAYKDICGHIGALVYERAVQLNDAALAKRVLDRLEALDLTDSDRWWAGFTRFNKAMMEGDVPHAAAAVGVFRKGQDVDGRFFGETYAIMLNLLGRKEEGVRWKSRSWAGSQRRAGKQSDLLPGVTPRFYWQQVITAEKL